MSCRHAFFVVTLLGIAAITSSCSSTPEVKSQKYAELQSERTFEEEMPTVYKAIENTLKNHKIVEKDPEEVGVLEMKKLKEASWETDWIYSRSRDKYQEYKVNGFPKKTYLQTRLKYLVSAEQTMGGIHVAVKTTEEIEQLKADGSSDGFSSSDKADSSRANEIIEKINQSLLSANP